MNQDNQAKIVCPRCGNQISITSRCCLNCGWLNASDPANQNMQQFVSDKEKSLYQVGSGQNIAQNSGQVATTIASNTGSRELCFVFNYLIYMLIIVLSYMLVLGNSVTNFYAVKNSIFPYIAFTTSIAFLFVYSGELIFMKANKRWWYSLIPIFNLFVLADIVFKKKWLGVLYLIPIIGQVFFLITMYILGTKFKYNGLLSMMFSIIYVPLMGFGSKLYEETNYTSGQEGTEKDYRNKKIFFISLVFFLLTSGGFIFWNNIVEIKSKAFRLTNYYYVLAANRIVEYTKQSIRTNNLECSISDYNDTSGLYYFEYSDVGEVTYMPLHYYKDVISSYVIVDNTSGSSKYYVSISDGTYGFAETLYEDVNLDSIVPYKELEKSKGLNTCVVSKSKSSIEKKK